MLTRWLWSRIFGIFWLVWLTANVPVSESSTLTPSYSDSSYVSFTSTQPVESTSQKLKNKNIDAFPSFTQPISDYTSTYDDLKGLSLSELETFFKEIEKNESKPKTSTRASSSVRKQSTKPQVVRFNSSIPASSSGMSLSPQTRRLINEISIYFSVAICLMGIITNFLSLKVRFF
jgi:hypothetical protein